MDGWLADQGTVAQAAESMPAKRSVCQLVQFSGVRPWQPLVLASVGFPRSGSMCRLRGKWRLVPAVLLMLSAGFLLPTMAPRTHLRIRTALLVTIKLVVGALAGQRPAPRLFLPPSPNPFKAALTYTLGLNIFVIFFSGGAALATACRSWPPLGGVPCMSCGLGPDSLCCEWQHDAWVPLQASTSCPGRYTWLCNAMPSGPTAIRPRSVNWRAWPTPSAAAGSRHSTARCTLWHPGCTRGWCAWLACPALLAVQQGPACSKPAPAPVLGDCGLQA